jgi:hypothetical protein
MTHPFHTIGAPPRIGRTVRATIGSTRKSRNALAKSVVAKSATVPKGGAVEPFEMVISR